MKNDKPIEVKITHYSDYLDWCGCKKCWPEMGLDVVCMKEAMAEFEANRAEE